MIRSIIIEGVDRLGKDTLIQGLSNQLGYLQRIHYEKPQLLDAYVKAAATELRTTNLEDTRVVQHALKAYQQASFAAMLRLLSSGAPLALNRAHLGEVVYSPRYRGYRGEYVFDLERDEVKLGGDFHKTTLLVLLHTSSFKFIQDDGLSFDFSKKEEEQMDFVRAFERSEIEHKLMLDVHDGADGFAPKEELLRAVVEAVQGIEKFDDKTRYVTWEWRGEGKQRALSQVAWSSPNLKNLVWTS